MIALIGLCLFAFDRLLVAEHDHCAQARAGQVMTAISGDLHLFFHRRLDAVTDLCRLLRESTPGPTADLERLGQELFGELEDVEFVRLVLPGGDIVATWPAASPIAAEDLPFPLDEMPSPDGPAAQIGATRPDSLDVVARLTGSEQSEAYVWARFGTRPLLRQLSGHDLVGTVEVFVSDGEGTPMIGAPRADPSDYPLAAPLRIPGKSWMLRARASSEAWYGLPLRRALMSGLGLIMIGAFGAVCFVQNRQHRDLSDHNLELAQQAEQHRAVVERLLRLNRDLDEFTYVVSHDLKEPLRGVEGIAKLLIEEYSDQIDETGRDYLQSIKMSGRRMRRLVDDLLRLSRVTRKRYPLERIVFSDLVEETLRTLDYHLKERAAEVVTQPHLPEIVSDRVRLAELLQNLISNALKFTQAPAPRIEVGYEPRTDSHLFWIQDNGIGVPPEDRKKIFNIFQRTSSTEFAEGSGVGLTICKRIVENLGGRIWVESPHRGGSRFCFTLPAGNEPSPAHGGHYEHIAAPHLVG
jgi:signal transduction histidine kinase